MEFPLDSILLDASSFISSEFNLALKTSTLKPYSVDNWQQFCQVNGFDLNSEGLYVPASYSAYVRTDSPVLPSNIFHELYGHGLFVEHSIIGKQLVDIIQNQGDEKGFMINEINPQEQPFGITKHNIQNYEGFAVWLEALLCKETDNSKVWELKKDQLPGGFIDLFEYFQDFEQRISRFGLLSQMGFPKYYDDNKVLDVVKRRYGSTFNGVDLVVLYGSQKPESDIDLFVVSNNPSKNYFNGWLDIYELNRNEFNQLTTHLDISITDPLFSGRLIYGDKNHFEQLKQQISSQQITQDATNHNLTEAEKQKQYLEQFSKSDKRRRDCFSYIDSFSQNAEQLSLGNRSLTLANLKRIYNPS